MIAVMPVIKLPLSPTRENGQTLPASPYFMYKKNILSNFCTLLFRGKVTVVAGDDHFKSNVSAWTVLGAGALEREGAPQISVRALEEVVHAGVSGSTQGSSRQRWTQVCWRLSR